MNSSTGPTDGRRWEIDALRGLMLVLMTLTHVPTRLASPLGQPFGYVSAAEGFVLLSAYMAGIVYTRRQQRDGEAGMSRAFLQRAWKIYLCQAALLLFFFSVFAGYGIVSGQPAVTELLRFYLDQPLTAFVSGLLLVYNPPMLDILPMYIILMGVSPLLLLVGGSRHGWPLLLGGSLALWFAAQFGLSLYAYEGIAAWAGIKVPFGETGAFGMLSWQLLWVLGLWMGSREASGLPIAGRFPRWMIVFAVVFASITFVWRHTFGHVPFPWAGEFNYLFDKWELGPLRLVNLFALVVITMHFAPRWVARMRGMPWLERLGAASLSVFCAHIVATLVARAVVGHADASRPVWLDAVVLGSTFALMYLVAWTASDTGRRRAGAPATTGVTRSADRGARSAML